MKVYNGVYDIDMAAVGADDVELVEMTTAELTELIEIVETLKASPTLREIVSGAKEVLEEMTIKKTAWGDLSQDHQFCALTFRAAMRAYEKKNMSAVKDAAG